MSRARNIKPGFFSNEDLAEIEPMGRLLFIGLWTLADREGRLEDRVKRIKAALFPYDNCEVDSLLNDLQTHGFILRYECQGVKCIQILTFSKHQKPHPNEKPSELPPPPTVENREKVVNLIAYTDKTKTENREKVVNQNSKTAVARCQNPTESLTTESLNDDNTPLPPKGEGDAFSMYTDSPELLSALRDFEAMRKAIKKPMQESTKGRMLKTLDRLASDDETKIAILNQSIDHNWQGLFELKKEESNGQHPRRGRTNARDRKEVPESINNLPGWEGVEKYMW